MGNSVKQCGLFEVLVFLLAIIFGTACSICSKTMMGLHGEGITGEIERFEKPIFQTLGMFVGMTFGLLMHWLVLFMKIPFPGYEHSDDDDEEGEGENTEGGAPAATAAKKGTIEEGFAKETDQLIPKKKPATSSGATGSNVPVWMYFFLAIPSIFDLGATALCMMGLRYLDVSIYQLLRGSGIIFVALMKQHVLGDVLYKFQWIGVVWNVVSVVMVGLTAVLNSNSDETKDPGEAFLGVLLVMMGAFVQALQFVFEEKVMNMEESSAPPLLLIGMEGLWGTVLCLVVVYPIVYYIPGDDHGSYEDPWNTYEMIMKSSTIQWSFVVYFFSIFGYNLFAVLVTYSLSSIWHAILDNFRPITVWCTDMFIFYVITQEGDFGEPWTKYSYIQLIGMFVLLYGTSVYNAPNSGSIKLKGEWFSLGIDLTYEYDAIDKEEREAEMEREWAERQVSFKQRRKSSLAERSPHVSVHTQALGAFGSTHI